MHTHALSVGKRYDAERSFGMGQNVQTFAKLGLMKAHKMGADSAEVFVVKQRSLELEMKNNNLEDLNQAEKHGVGIRVLCGKRQGFSFSTDFRKAALDQMVHQAIVNSRYNDVDSVLGFPERSMHYPQPVCSDIRIARQSLEERLALVQETVQHAKRWSKQVCQVERAGYEEGVTEAWLANSNGVLLHQQGSYCGLFCLALGEKDGDRQSGYGMDSSVSLCGLSPERVGQMAGRRAVELLGATNIPSGVMDLVLDPLVAAQIFGIISTCFSGEAVQKQKSFLAGCCGEQVASTALTLVDDGTLSGRLGSGSFDGEGTPTQRTVLLEQGVLQQYLYDFASAAQAGTVSTGNGVRGSYQGTPHVGTTNYYLEAGQQSPQQMIAEVSRGLYVTAIMGAHTANPVSGDFSFGASGILIEHGCFCKPVRGITIAGNFQELLKKVKGVGNDLTFFGSQGAPTVCIGDIAVSGT